MFLALSVVMPVNIVEDSIQPQYAEYIPQCYQQCAAPSSRGSGAHSFLGSMLEKQSVRSLPNRNHLHSSSKNLNLLRETSIGAFFLQLLASFHSRAAVVPPSNTSTRGYRK